MSSDRSQWLLLKATVVTEVMVLVEASEDVRCVEKAARDAARDEIGASVVNISADGPPDDMDSGDLVYTAGRKAKALGLIDLSDAKRLTMRVEDDGVGEFDTLGHHNFRG